MEESRPPRIPPRLKAVPVIRGLYWCDFPNDAHLPEFWKRRPVLVVSYKNTLSGTVTVVPCSSQDQTENVWAYRLLTSLDERASWAICDKITSVAVSRLSASRHGKVRVNPEEFQGVLKLIFRWLPRLEEDDS